MLLKIHPETPGHRQVQKAIDIFKGGGVIIFPTDTVYGLGCDVFNHKAVERVANIKGISLDKAHFSFICHNLSHLTDYARHVNNPTFKLMKQHLPGPYTFILPATGFVPKKISPKRKTVGVRIPDYPAIQQLVGLLDEPLANTSINIEEHLRGDPDEVGPAVSHEVEVMLDAGRLSDPVGSTIIDLTGDVPALVRQGKGAWGDDYG